MQNLELRIGSKAKFLDLYEKKARQAGFTSIAGVDEVGRGPLAGPLVVVACLLSEAAMQLPLDDSKRLSKQKRQELYEALLSDSMTFYYLVSIPPKRIDEINIFRATLEGMKEAIEGLRPRVDFALIDGPFSPSDLPIESMPLVQGDRLSKSIAAASILAKVSRDRYMEQIHLEDPRYDFDRNKGYPTQKHLEALRKYGPSSHHRESFKPVRMHL